MNTPFVYSQPVGWSCQTFSGELSKKPGKICSSAHTQLWPYVLPAIPIEKSSLYPPEVHSINLVKRIQRLKKKKTDTRLRRESRWPHRLSACPCRESEERGQDREKGFIWEWGRVAGEGRNTGVKTNDSVQIIKFPSISSLDDATSPTTWRQRPKPSPNFLMMHKNPSSFAARLINYCRVNEYWL